MSSIRNGASPGGPVVSAAKRKRLAALDDALSAAVRHKQDKPAETLAVAKSANAQPARGSIPPPYPPARSGAFPYNPLDDAVLDGSLSAALANAKAAAQAAATATASIHANAFVATNQSHGASSRGARAAARACSAAAASAAAAAAAAAASGNSTVAAEVLAQLVATNPRASSDLRNILESRLQDKTVVLENPVAKDPGLGSRRSTNYSSKLRSGRKAKASRPRPEVKQQRPPSYQSMLRVHELWQQYTQKLAGTGSAPSGPSAAASGSTAGGGAKARATPGPTVELLGALVTVVRHCNPLFVGASGILLRCSASSMHLVTPDDRLRVVPVKGCTAHYTLNGRVMKLTG